jgi:type I restriction enzyme R subunit
VFGDYISIYDIQRAVADKATVPIYYESRIAKLGLNAAELPKLDAEFEEITEGEELTPKEKLKTKWAALEALVGDPKRIALIAADLVAHFEKRLEAMDGKAMIVCMSRRICVDLYNALIAAPRLGQRQGRRRGGREGQGLRGQGGHDRQRRRRPRVAAAHPQQGQAPQAGQPLQGQQGPVPHRHRARHVADRLRRALPAHDVRRQADAGPRPDAGHRPREPRLPRQAGGLVVDYLGLADQLKQALATYTESGGQGDPTFDTAQAIAVMLEKHGIACDMLHGFNWDKWTTGKPTERLALIPAGQEHILAAGGRQEALRAGGDGALPRLRPVRRERRGDRDPRRRELLPGPASRAEQAEQQQPARPPSSSTPPSASWSRKAITAEGQVIDVFTAAGLPKPDISILSDQFLAEVRGLKHKNVAAELLEKLLKDELKVRAKRNLVQSQLFSEKLKKTLNAYHNRAISTHEVIEELIKLAKEMDAATKRGEDLGLTDDEIAFYDALAANDSAVKAMGDAKLKVIAAELITQVRKSVTIDWTLREGARPRSA